MKHPQQRRLTHSVGMLFMHLYYLFRISFIYSLTISYMYIMCLHSIHVSFPLYLPTDNPNMSSFPFHVFSFWGECHWVHFIFPETNSYWLLACWVLTDLVDLTLCRSYASNHSCSKLMSTMTMLCPEDSMAQHLSPGMLPESCACIVDVTGWKNTKATISQIEGLINWSVGTENWWSIFHLPMLKMLLNKIFRVERW